MTGHGHIRQEPELSFVAKVALRLDAAVSVGDTPDGVRMQFTVRGTVDGPRLSGEFQKGTLAFLRIDRDGVGTIHVRAPLLLRDGARAELDATGRYDFGEDGYSRAKQGPEHLPDSDLGWCPRLVTLDPRYLWVNRTQFLGLGRLVPRETRVDYDLFAMKPKQVASRTDASTLGQPGPGSLYERLGGRKGIYRLMSASIDSLHDNEQLNRQNAKLAQAKLTTNPTDLKEKVTDFFCRITGGPCLYRGRTMRNSHAHLDITDADWRVFIDDTIRIMTELKLPGREQDDLLALIETLKNEIVKNP
jgi:hemoglobin